VLGLGLWLIMTHVHPIFVRVFKTYDRLNSVIQENLHGIRVVKSYIREDYEEQKFAGISQSIFQDFSKAEKRLAFNMPLMQFCLYTSMLLLSWFGAKEIIATTNNPVAGLSTGELASLITYAMQILMSLMMLSMVFVMIIISRASAERIVEILNEESDLKNGENPVYTVRDGSITFGNVTFSYAQKPTSQSSTKSIFPSRPGNDRHSRRDRLFQVEPRPADPSPLRCRERKSKRRRPRCAGLRYRVAPQSGGDGAAEECAVFRHGQRESPLGQ
jgi:ABC-type multidrug transport system, ATPase and permease components